MCMEARKKEGSPPLQGKRIYLSGPIEHAEIKDSDWRSGPREVLSNEFQLELLDPFADEKQQWVPELQSAQKKRNFKVMRDITKKFVRKDLSWVDRCDFLIANLPYGVPTAGTHHEIIYSNDRKKPTLLVCEQGKEYIYAWYWGFIGDRERADDDYMFDSFEEVYEYLREVNDWKHTNNFDWHYVYGLI